MMSTRFLATVALLPILLTGGCQGAGDDGITPAAAPAVDFTDLFEAVRDKLPRSMTVYRGDILWSVDSFGQLHRSDDRGHTWSHIELPDDNPIVTMKVGAGGQRAIVVTETGVLMRTSDAANTWAHTDLLSQLGEGVDTEWGGDYDTFTFDDDLTEGQWVDFCQVFRTTDGGQTWTRHGDGLQDTDEDLRCVSDVVVDPASGAWFAEVYVSGRILTSGDYLFRSDDGSATWQEICSLDEIGMLIKKIPSCFDLEDADEALIKGVKALVGEGWAGQSEVASEFFDKLETGVFIKRSLIIPEELRGNLELVGLVEDAESGRIWRDYEDQLAYTDDGGKRWQVVSSGLPDNEHLDFSLGLDRGFGIYQYNYLALSEDLGKTWQIVNQEPSFIYDLKVLADHDRAVVATEEGISVVDAMSLEWRDVEGVSEAHDLQVVGDVIWSFSGDDAVHRSVDAGLSWQRLPVNDGGDYIYVESASCTDGHCLLEGSDAIVRLTADPYSFELIDITRDLPDLEENYIVEMILDAERDRAWVAIDDGRVYGSKDGGRTWLELADLNEELTEFTSAPGKERFIARSYTGNYLWSKDGLTFERRRVPSGRDTFIGDLCWVSDSVALFNAYIEEEEDDASFASLDGGATWGPIEAAYFGEDCRIRGGLFGFYTEIATLR